MASFKYKHVSTVKTYACNTATMISKPVNATKSKIGAIPKTPSAAVKPAKTFIIVCPAIIFAKSLTDRLTGLDKYEITSIGTSKISIAFGTPLGAKKPRNLTNPCFRIAIKVTKIKMKNDIAKVTII